MSTHIKIYRTLFSVLSQLLIFFKSISCLSKYITSMHKIRIVVSSSDTGESQNVIWRGWIQTQTEIIYILYDMISVYYIRDWIIELWELNWQKKKQTDKQTNSKIAYLCARVCTQHRDILHIPHNLSFAYVFPGCIRWCTCNERDIVNNGCDIVMRSISFDFDNTRTYTFIFKKSVIFCLWAN